METLQQKIIQHLQKTVHAVIATSSNTGQPEAALIGFGETQNLEIIFGTSNLSRKYKNLQENKRVALVIGGEADFISVQYEGVVRELNKSEWDAYLETYHNKVPSAIHYRNNPDQAYFIITPTWIRYGDFNGLDEKFEEMRF